MHFDSRLFFVLVLSTAAVACEEGEPTGSVCPTGSQLTYDNFGKHFFETYCYRCHDAQHEESPKLDSIMSIRSHIGDIDKMAAAGPKATNDEMPEDGTAPSVEERKKLGEWLACGAP